MFTARHVEYTLAASAAVVAGSPNGTATQIHRGVRRVEAETSSGAPAPWLMPRRGRLLIQVTNINGGTLTGTLQGLVPGAASTSTTATDWYNIVEQFPPINANGTYSFVVPADNPLSPWMRFQPTVATATVTFAAFFIGSD